MQDITWITLPKLQKQRDCYIDLSLLITLKKKNEQLLVLKTRTLEYLEEGISVLINLGHGATSEFRAIFIRIFVRTRGTIKGITLSETRLYII